MQDQSTARAIPIQSADAPDLPPIYSIGLAADLHEKGRWRVSYLVDDIIPAQGLSLIVADPKVGKTTWARACALHVASQQETHFFGHVLVPSNVLLLSFDEYAGYTLAHIRNLARTRGIDLERTHLDFIDERYPDPVGQLEEAITRTEANLVFVDAMHHVIDAESFIDYKAVADAMVPIRQLAHKHECHISLIHHAKKDRGAHGVNQVSGSAQLAGAVDQIILLERKTDGTRTLTTHGRGPEIGPLIVEFDAKTGEVTNGGPYKPRSRQASDRDSTIREYMMQNPDDGYSVASIQAGTSVGRNAVEAALKSLVAEGAVTKTPGGGPKAAIYRIA